MIKLSLTFTFLLGTVICYSQTIPDTSRELLNKDTSKYKKYFLYVLKRPDSTDLQMSTMIGINPKDLVAIDVIRGKQAIELYGQKGVNGVIELQIKQGFPMLSIPQALKQFKISDSNSHLPVFIDSRIAYHPENIYLEPSVIISITVEKEKDTGMMYINIHTIFD